MTFGLRCCQPACRPHQASLPVRVPTVESLLSASFSFTSRLRLAVSLRLPSSAPVGSFHPTRFCPCWAHWRRLSSLLGRDSSRPSLRGSTQAPACSEDRLLTSAALRHADQIILVSNYFGRAPAIKGRIVVDMGRPIFSPAL